jgi:hypothetical protein
MTQLSIDPDRFSKAVTGLAMQPCEVEFYADCPAGKTKEIKDELIKAHSGLDYKKDARKLLKPFEKDGWVGSASDLSNHYNFVSHDKGYRVHFIRFV